MKITLDVRKFNELMDFTSKFIGKDKTRPVISQVLLEVRNGKLTATALDGYKIGKISFYNKDWEDGSMIIPPMKRMKIKDTSYVTISEDDENIIFETATGSQSVKKFKGDFFKFDSIFPEDKPKEVFRMTAGNIANALSAFPKDEYVDIEYRGEIEPLIVKGDGSIALVLPVRRPKR